MNIWCVFSVYRKSLESEIMVFFERGVGEVNIMRIIECFISIVASFVIMIITLHHEKKSNKLNIDIQQHNYESEMKKNEEHHRELLMIQEEKNRAEMLPYLKLDSNITLGRRKGNTVFPLKLVNIGNSAAFDIRICFEVIENINYIYRDKYFDSIIYIYSGFMSDNVLTVGQAGGFEMIRVDYYDKAIHEVDQNNKIGEIKFSVLYKDSTLKNEYEQNYMIQYNIDEGVGRVESYIPKLRQNCSLKE